MFDDVKQPEDMFAETDKVSPQPTPPTETVQPASAPAVSVPEQVVQAPVQTAPVLKPTTPSAMPLQPEIGAMPAAKGGSMKVIVIVVAILVVIAAAFYISLRILRSSTPTTPEPPVQTETTPIPVVVPEVVQEVIPEPVVESEVVVDVDSDKDGLMDSEEAILGTDPESTDTDADGLYDREEVEVYETDPLNPDSDGDTYLDGAEVKAGYNPNGSGSLREIPLQ